MNGYYTLIRFVVKIGSVAYVLTEIENGQNFWDFFFFGLIAILFILLIPIYFNDKSAWMPIDIIGGKFFVIKSFTLKQK